MFLSTLLGLLPSDISSFNMIEILLALRGQLKAENSFSSMEYADTSVPTASGA